jgi:hypothetical protein
MPFDNEPETRIELIFHSGKANDKNGLAMPASAYIAMGSHSEDERQRPMITTRETSFGALEAQVEHIKATLDARVAEAKARFAANTQ